MTATLNPMPIGPAAITVDSLHRFSVLEYLRLIRDGIIPDGASLELLDGLLVRKIAQNPPHDTAVSLVTQELLARVPIPAWCCRVQCSVQLPGSVPLPDFVVALGPGRRYGTGHPEPAVIALLVEVADSSLAIDQGAKLRLYAAADIVLYWIVNLPDRRVEVYTQPSGTGNRATYNDVQVFGPNDDILLTLGGVALPPLRVADILP